MNEEFKVFEPLRLSFAVRSMVSIFCMFGLFAFFFYGLNQINNKILVFGSVAIGGICFLIYYNFVLNRFVEIGTLLFNDKGLYINTNEEDCQINYDDVYRVYSYYYYSSSQFGFYHELQYATTLVIERSNKEKYELICKVKSKNNLIAFLKNLKKEKQVDVLFIKSSYSKVDISSTDDTLIDDLLI